MARYSYPAIFGGTKDSPTINFIDFPGNKIGFSADYDPMLFAERRLMANLAMLMARLQIPPKATPFLKVRPAEGEEVKLITVEWGGR